MKGNWIFMSLVSALVCMSCGDFVRDMNFSRDKSDTLISTRTVDKHKGIIRAKDSGVYRGEEVLTCIENPDLCEGDGELNTRSAVHISNFVKGCLESPDSCDDKIEVIVAFDETPERVPQENYILDWYEGSMHYNGARMTEDEIAAWNTREDVRRHRVLENVKLKRIQTVEALEHAGIELDSESREQYINSYETFRASLSIEDIRKMLSLDFTLGIEMFVSPEDLSLAYAMDATSMTSGLNLPNHHKGDKIGIYMSEHGCPDSGYLNPTNNDEVYHKISGTSSFHSRNVSMILKTVSPNNYLYCKSDCVLPSENDLYNAHNSSHSDIFLVNMSCGSYGEPLMGCSDPENGCYNDCNLNPSSCTRTGEYNIVSRCYDDFVYNAGITVVNAAGNCGNVENVDVGNIDDCSVKDGFVISQGLGMNVLTVGNYNDYDNNPLFFERFPTSSFINPTNTHNLKPEVSAPGTMICTEGASICQDNSNALTGTSQAAPFVTGMLANRASAWTTPTLNILTPDLMRMFAFQGATDMIGVNIDSNNDSYNYLTSREVVGVGGVDFWGMYDVQKFSWIRGEYMYLAANDNGLNVNMIEKTFNVSNGISSARVVVAWLNRGTYVYDHRNSNLPGGVAYAVLVYDPTNNLLEAELDRYNNFVVLDVDTPMTGVYRVYISRVWSYDTDLDLKMAWGVTLY